MTTQLHCHDPAHAYLLSLPVCDRGFSYLPSWSCNHWRLVLRHSSTMGLLGCGPLPRHAAFWIVAGRAGGGTWRMGLATVGGSLGKAARVWNSPNFTSVASSKAESLPSFPDVPMGDFPLLKTFKPILASRTGGLHKWPLLVLTLSQERLQGHSRIYNLHSITFTKELGSPPQPTVHFSISSSCFCVLQSPLMSLNFVFCTVVRNTMIVPSSQDSNGGHMLTCLRIHNTGKLRA